MIANQSQISEKCSEQIYKLTEIQSDAYNMDRNLYNKCKRDKEILCENVIFVYYFLVFILYIVNLNRILNKKVVRFLFNL